VVHCSLLSRCACNTAGFDATGSSASLYVAGPASNGALLFRTTVGNAPFYGDAEPPGVVVDADDVTYFTNTTGFGAVNVRGGLLWWKSCGAGLMAATTPALASFSGAAGLATTVLVVCTSSVGSTAYAVLTNSGNVQWAEAVSSTWVLAHPVVIPQAANTLFIICDDAGVVSALRASDGGKAWGAAPNLGSPVRSTPCFDGELLVTFTVGGSAAGVSIADGSVVWHEQVFPAGLGPSSACGVSHDAITGAVVAAAAGHSFAVVALSTASGARVCSVTTDADVTEGVAVANGTFLVSSQNSVTSFVVLGGTCLSLWTVPVEHPHRAAVDGAGIAYVSFAGGVVALDTAWLSPTRELWLQNATGEWWNPVAVGATGSVFGTTQQGSVAGVGATATMVDAHTRSAAMSAMANPGNAEALATLHFLCVVVNQSVAGFSAQGRVDLALQSALNHTCAVYSMVNAGLNPLGTCCALPPSSLWL
jgi:hypothetical protein